MERKDFDKLVNRELDGLTSPEEEAQLMDYAQRHPEAAADQDALHRIHRAFQEMPRAACQPELGSRIADRILSEPPSMARFRLPALLGRAAAILMVVSLAGLGGFWLGQGGETQAAPTTDALNVSRFEEAWAVYDLDSAQLGRVLECRADFERRRDRMIRSGATAAQLQELEEEQTGSALKLLRPEQRARYCDDHGITAGRARALMDPAGR